jgi:uncharacterized protein YkwD
VAVANTPAQPAIPGASQPQDLFLQLINGQRTARNLPQMTLQAPLTRVAQRIANGQNNINLSDALVNEGYLFEGLSQMEGGIGDTSRESLTRVVNSSSALMSPDYTDIGIAILDTRYVILMSKPAVLTAPSASAALTGSPTSSGQESEIVRLLNAARMSAGLQPLSIAPQLTQAAVLHSQDQAQRDVMSHTGSDQSSVADRVQRANYAFTTVGENVLARPNIHAAGAFDQWWNSQGHFENMMNPNFTNIGIAIAGSGSGRYYYTMVLGSN